MPSDAAPIVASRWAGRLGSPPNISAQPPDRFALFTKERFPATGMKLGVDAEPTAEAAP